MEGGSIAKLPLDGATPKAQKHFFYFNLTHVGPQNIMVKPGEKIWSSPAQGRFLVSPGQKKNNLVGNLEDINKKLSNFHHHFVERKPFDQIC